MNADHFAFDEEQLLQSVASASELASSASDGRLVDWVFEEQRLFDRRDRRTPDDEAEANGRALMTQALARHLGIRRVEQSPAFVDASPALRDESALAPYFELGVAAGDGRELTDDSVDRFVQFDQQLSGKSKDGFVAIRVVGDSMAPVMHTGDVVLVRRGHDVAVGSTIVARHPDDGYVCKRVDAIRDVEIRLGSVDPSRAPISIPLDSRLIVGTVMLVWSTPPRSS